LVLALLAFRSTDESPTAFIDLRPQMEQLQSSIKATEGRLAALEAKLSGVQELVSPAAHSVVGDPEDSTLRLPWNAALRGTLKGNLIVGGVVLLVETSWNIYEHNGMVAFRSHDFYEQLAGSVSATGIGGIAFFYSSLAATAAASELGPAAPFVGTVTGLVVATRVSIVAYVGGRSATAWLLRTVSPALYQQYERQQINAATSAIPRRLSCAQSLM
jgi:hypothetical protein